MATHVQQKNDQNNVLNGVLILSGTWLAPLASEEIVMNKEKGAIGYILLWLMGVPATVLFLIFLLRGCN